jgi:hypothetical protein
VFKKHVHLEGHKNEKKREASGGGDGMLIEHVGYPLHNTPQVEMGNKP